MKYKNDSNNKLTEDMIQYLIEKCNVTDYGEITIILNKTLNTTDIIVKDRKKFEKC